MECIRECHSSVTVPPPRVLDCNLYLMLLNRCSSPQMSEWVIATFLGFQHHLYEYWENQKRQTWVTPESDEDTEDAVGLRMHVPAQVDLPLLN